MEYISVDQAKKLMNQIAEKIIAEEANLTTIDRAIGDGDHGIGMRIGMEKVIETINAGGYRSVELLFQEVGMAMINSMGGASGVLFGSLFLGLSKANKGKDKLDIVGIYQGLNQALTDIQTRGKAKVGDKTMVDALEPAVKSLEQSLDCDDLFIALESASKAAEKGMESTKQYKAKYGRAKNLGDRAIGYQDAGATSIYFIVQEMANFVQIN